MFGYIKKRLSITSGTSTEHMTQNSLHETSHNLEVSTESKVCATQSTQTQEPQQGCGSPTSSCIGRHDGVVMNDTKSNANKAPHSFMDNIIPDNERFYLEQFTKRNTEKLSLNGNVYFAKVVYVYDGDTVHVVFKEFGNYFRWNCRIIGVDTPEIRTSNPDEKQKAIEVRDILREYIDGEVLPIYCYDFDKYGRLLIDIEVPEVMRSDADVPETLSQWLVKNEYAYCYDGGTKKSW